MENGAAFIISVILPLIYLIICIAFVLGIFRAFRNLEKLVGLHAEANQLRRELLAEFKARK
jgi:hypothetical protein